MERRTDWQCISCGEVLGQVLGSEIYPNVPGKSLRTSGPNLTFTCPNCGSIKVWYSSDPIVRAMYQLVNALATVSAQAMVEQIGKAMHKRE